MFRYNFTIDFTFTYNHSIKYLIIYTKQIIIRFFINITRVFKYNR